MILRRGFGLVRSQTKPAQGLVRVWCDTDAVRIGEPEVCLCDGKPLACSTLKPMYGRIEVVGDTLAIRVGIT